VSVFFNVSIERLANETWLVGTGLDDNGRTRKAAFVTYEEAEAWTIGELRMSFLKGKAKLEAARQSMQDERF
jgi:hypothetical protein